MSNDLIQFTYYSTYNVTLIYLYLLHYVIWLNNSTDGKLGNNSSKCDTKWKPETLKRYRYHNNN
jgi:hypothetical protein